MQGMALLPETAHPPGHTHPHALQVVLVVADELQMSPGKLAAQCSHAAVGLYRAMSVSSTPWLDAWQEQGEKTVVLRGDTMDLLVALQAHAQELQLLTYMVWVDIRGVIKTQVSLQTHIQSPHSSKGGRRRAYRGCIWVKNSVGNWWFE